MHLQRTKPRVTRKVPGYDSPTGPTRTIHLVVACTDRKTQPPSPEARARTLFGNSLADRVSAWTDTLSVSGSKRIPAEQLYAGDNWQVAKSTVGVAPEGVHVRIWVCSAGYGLLTPETLVCAYAATFTPGHADSVVPRGSAYTTSEWWSALAEWAPAGTGHRSIASLATSAARTRDFVLVALPQSYLRAVIGDLTAAALAIGDRLAILSVGAQPGDFQQSETDTSPLTDHLLPSDVRLKNMVGGAMHSLNVRVARKLLSKADEWIDNPTRLRELLNTWIDATPALEQFDRDRCDDESVKDFIRAALKDSPKAKHTGLLRVFRVAGRACEQTRFRELYRTVSTEGDMFVGQKRRESRT